MKTRMFTKIIPLFASTLLFAACSQQPSTIPEAGGGRIGGNSSGAGNTNGSGSANNGSNTQGANMGNGAGTQSTGSGGGYQTGGNNGNNQGHGGSEKSGSGYTLADLKNPNSLLSKRIIYFDYDKAAIKPQYQAILNAHAELLAKHPQVDIRLEGHADERGTREYNVALSEERGKAVQWIMRGKGVKSSQTEVIAYGEERPAVVSDGEKSWAKNRRVEIKYPGR